MTHTGKIRLESNKCKQREAKSELMDILQLNRCDNWIPLMDFPDISLSYVQQQTVSGPLKCTLRI